MLLFIFSIRPIEWLQSNAPLQPVKQAFTKLSSSENLLTFLQTPEFRLFIIIVTIVSIAIIGVHVWAWIRLLLQKDNLSSTYTLTSRGQTPPSQGFMHDARLWQSSRLGLMPEFGLVDHTLEEPEPNREEPAPTRGGDLP